MKLCFVRPTELVISVACSVSGSNYWKDGLHRDIIRSVFEVMRDMRDSIVMSVIICLTKQTYFDTEHGRL